METLKHGVDHNRKILEGSQWALTTFCFSTESPIFIHAVSCFVTIALRMLVLHGADPPTNTDVVELV